MEDLDIKIILSLIAVIISFVGLIITKEQKTSEFRQKWIDEIRADIASLMGTLSHFSTKWLILKNKEDLESRRKFLDDNISLINEMHVLLYRIELRLNPENDKDLIEVLNNIDLMIKSPSKMNQDSEFENLTEELSSQSHKMLKTEWERVKNGEPFFAIIKYLFGIIVAVAFLKYLTSL